MRQQVDAIKARNRALEAQSDDLEELLQSSIARMEKVRSMITGTADSSRSSNDLPRLAVAVSSKTSARKVPSSCS